jgi:hypothetical protein
LGCKHRFAEFTYHTTGEEDVRNELLKAWNLLFKPRRHWHQKKIYRVDFFVKAISSGLTSYVIRHNSQ